MILEFFLTIFAVSSILILFGKHIDISLGFVGGAFLFLLGVVILVSPITLHVTDNITTTYDYMNDTSTQLNETVESRNPQYTTFDVVIPALGLTFNHIIGVFMGFIGIAAIAALVLGRRKP